MEFFRFKKDIPFMSYGKLTTAVSLVTFLLSVFFLAYYHLNLSVEFTGGTMMEVEFAAPADLTQVRAAVDGLSFGSAQTQSGGTSKNVLIRLRNQENVKLETISNQVHTALQQISPQVEIKKVEFIGPQIGHELVTHGLFALVMVALGIIAYLALRFEWRFALSALIANVHDVVIILGCFAFFQWEFSLTVMAGVLAVLGYSVNESVIVFDRIRENFRKPEMRDKSLPRIIDNAITATMSRTVITHGSTEAMVLSMFFFGGEALHGFAIALTIGIVFGVYSSILVASPLLLLFGVTRENLIKKTRKKEEIVV